MRQETKVKSLPLVAIGGVLAFALLAIPFGVIMVRSTRKALEDQSTFGLSKSRNQETPSQPGLRGSRRPPSREPEAKANETRVVESSAVERTPRESIWDVMTSTGRGVWMRTDEIAASTRLSEPVAADELAALVAEGYLQENRDRSGRPVFKIPA